MLDKPPAPLNTDFYATDNSDSIRGTAVRVGEAIDVHVSRAQLLSKVPHKFDNHCAAPSIPSDPLYVLPRSKYTVHDSRAAFIGNAIVEALRLVSPVDATLEVNAAKMKVSVLIPSSLDMKIKMFASGDDTLVTFRRDSGDWFVFIHIFSAIKKYLRHNCALSIESH
jgi:hypothetical protein